MNALVNPSGEGSEGEQPEDAGLTVDEKFAKLTAEFDSTQKPRRPWRTEGPKVSPYPTSPADPFGPRRRKTAAARARTSAKALAALLFVGLIGYGFWPRHHAPTPLNATPAGTAQPWTIASAAAASASPSASPTFTNPDDAYFVGSPALSWADNEAGFVIPPAAAINGVSRSDIVDGYQLLEKLLAAGNLDATVLNGGSVSDFTSLLDPANSSAKQLNSSIAHPSFQNDPTQMVTRFNPATTRLLGHTVKVDGSMSAKADTQRGSAILTADYIFVYAVAPASNTANPLRVSVHRTMEIQVVNPADFQPMNGKAWLLRYTAAQANIQCYQYDGYVDPGFTEDGPAPNKSGTIDPYATGNLLTESPQPSASSSEECQAITGD
jgi:hypothetical protein